MYIKVSNKPWQSLVKQGFGRITQFGEDVLVKNGIKYHVPRSVDRALRNESNGRKVKPFQFLLKEVGVSDWEGNPSNLAEKRNLRQQKSTKIKNLPGLHHDHMNPDGTEMKPSTTKTYGNLESWWATNGPQITKLMPKEPAKPKYILTDGVVSFYHDGKSFSTSKQNPMFDKVVASLKAGDMETSKELCNIASAIDRASDGVIKAKDGVLQHNSVDLHESASDWVLRNMHRGKSAIQPIVNFLGRVKANIHPESVEGLWRFIRECGLIITPTGKFICYKYVRDDMMDAHSGTLDYSLGNIVEMKREDVEFNPSKGCGPGIHGGSMSFVSGQSTILELVIDPIDVVSVPYDSSNQKLRCCRAESWKILKHKGQEISQPTKQEEFFSLN